MTTPSIHAALQQLDCLLADLDRRDRDRIAPGISQLIQDWLDAEKGKELWEQRSLRQQREIVSLYAQLDVLQGKVKSQESLIRRLDALVQRAEEAAGRRLLRMAGYRRVKS